METSQKNTTKPIIFIVLVIIVVIALWFFGFKPSAQNVETSAYFSIDSRDTVAWELPKNFSFAGDKEIALQNIAELKEKLSEEGADTFEITLGIGQTYGLMGDLEKEYDYTLKAIDINPKRSVAWVSLGTLMKNQGAYYSAEKAFKQAIEAEPQFEQNHLSLFYFYKDTSPERTDAIEHVFLNAKEATQNKPNILKEYAAWLEEEGRISDAIAAWEDALLVSENKEAIQARIEKLKAKQ